MKTNRPIKNILRLALGLGLSVSGSVTSTQAANYHFTTIDHPLGINGTFARAINATGAVVGSYVDAANVPHGYLLRQGVFETIDHPLGVNGTRAWGVNDAGTVVGFYLATNGTHGFVLQNGAYAMLDYPLASSTAAYGISSSGEVVGNYGNASGTHGFRFKNGIFTTIDNPLGADPDCGWNGAYGVNASGAVVGEWDDFCGNAPYQSAYLLKDGVYATINHPGTRDFCFAVGINDSGAVVGYFESRVITNNTFFIIPQSYVLKDGIYNTNIVHPLFPYATLASGINAGGQVVGSVGDFSRGFHGFIATPVAGSTLGFQPKHYNPGEASGSVTLTIVRSGDTNTAITVEYATSNRTATAGADYTAASGTLAFAPAEVEKTIQIALLDDGAVEGTEAFHVTLLNPIGATLAATNVATVEIADNELPVVLDTSLNPGTGVSATEIVGPPVIYDLTVLPDGKMIAIGSFTRIQGIPRAYIARLNTNGTVDQTFNANVSGGSPYGMVIDLRVQPDGKIVIVGTFATVGGVSRNYVARLNSNGTLDTSFDPGAGADQPVARIELLPDGRMFIGGQFNTYAGIPRQNLARLNTNGTLDTTFNAGSFGDGGVSSIAVQTNGEIIAGGSFTNVAGTTRACLARFKTNGALDTAFVPLIETDFPFFRPEVQKVRLQLDGRIVVASYFLTSIGGVPRPTLARLNTDGSLDLSFKTSLKGFSLGENGGVSALVLQPDGKIVMSGYFTFENGDVRQLIRLNLDGSRDKDFDSELSFNFDAPSNVSVDEVTVAQNGTLLISGSFTNVSGLNLNGLARIFTDAGPGRAVEFVGLPWVVASESGPDPVFTIRRRGPTDQPLIVQMMTTSGSAIAGVDFSNVNTPVNFAALQNEATVMVPLIDDFLSETDKTFRVQLSAPADVGAGLSQVTATILDDDRPGSLDLAFSTLSFPTNSANGLTVSQLAWLPGGRFFATLNLHANDFGSRPQLFRFLSDGTLDATFTPVVDVAFVGALANGEALIVREGTNLLRVSSTGGIDPAFHAVIDRTMEGFQPVVLSGVVPAPEGRLLVFGNFQHVNGVARAGLARLKDDGSLDPGYQPNLAQPSDPNFLWVQAATLQADNKLCVAGNFETVGGTARVGIARLQTNGTLDTTFTVGPGLSGVGYALALQPDGRIIVGGRFDAFNGNARNSLVRLNTNGTLDTSFSIGSGFQVLNSGFVIPALIEGILLQPDGRLLVRGQMDRFNGAPIAGLIRLNTNGTRDVAFELSNSSLFPEGTYFQPMVLLPEGDILVGPASPYLFCGCSTPSGSLPLGPIVRLNGDPALRIVGTSRPLPNRFRLKINSLQGHVYRCEASTNLIDWTVFDTRSGIATPLEFQDAALTNTAARFFRVVKP